MKRKFITITCLLFSIIWLWSRKGADFDLTIERNGKNLYIFLENYLLAKADIGKNNIEKIGISFSYQDLYGKYFEGQSSTDKDEFLPYSDTFKVKFKLLNPFVVISSFQGEKDFTFVFAPYRHLSSNWIDNGNTLSSKETFKVKINFFKGFKWILWLVFKPYPFLFPIFIFVYLLTGKWEKNEKNLYKNRRIFKGWFIVPIIIISSSTIWSNYLIEHYSKQVPHVPDSVEYLLFSKVIASGKLVIPIKDIPFDLSKENNKELFYPWFSFYEKNMYVPPYPPGHPIILAIGQLFNKVNLVPPLVGSFVLGLIFLISFRLTKSMLFSIFAILTCFSSPFFQTQTIDYMSHNTTSLFILLTILPLIFGGSKSYFFSGFFLGMTINSRPLTALAVFLAILTYEIFILFYNKNWKIIITKILYSIAGICLPLLLFFYYNSITTGNFFVPTYAQSGILNNVGLGIGKDFQIGFGILHGFSNIAVFSLFFLRNYYISFAPFLMSFILIPFYGKNILKIIFLQILTIYIFFIWVFYDGNFFMYGPRFIYEIVPVLSIIYAVTFFYFYKLFTGIFVKIFMFDKKITVDLPRIVFFSALTIFVFNIIIFEMQWLGFKKPEYEGIVFVPSNINELRNFNSVEGKFNKIYKENKGKEKTYLMKKCVNWWCTGEGIWLNSFPLSKSKPLFLSLPDNYDVKEFKNPQIINWETITAN